MTRFVPITNRFDLPRRGGPHGNSDWWKQIGTLNPSIEGSVPNVTLEVMNKDMYSIV